MTISLWNCNSQKRGGSNWSYIKESAGEVTVSGHRGRILNLTSMSDEKRYDNLTQLQDETQSNHGGSRRRCLIGGESWA